MEKKRRKNVMQSEIAYFESYIKYHYQQWNLKVQQSGTIAIIYIKYKKHNFFQF